jgi:hypothetical protein
MLWPDRKTALTAGLDGGTHSICGDFACDWPGLKPHNVSGFDIKGLKIAKCGDATLKLAPQRAGIALIAKRTKLNTPHRASNCRRRWFRRNCFGNGLWLHHFWLFNHRHFNRLYSFWWLRR